MHLNPAEEVFQMNLGVQVESRSNRMYKSLMSDVSESFDWG